MKVVRMGNLDQKYFDGLIDILFIDIWRDSKQGKWREKFWTMHIFVDKYEIWNNVMSLNT